MLAGGAPRGGGLGWYKGHDLHSTLYGGVQPRHDLRIF
jgi:hypothetical protein